MSSPTTPAAAPRARMGASQWIALIAGLTAAGITAANLVGHALAEGHLGLAEANALGLLVATIAFGLLAKAARSWAYRAGFGLVFVAGTLLVLYASVGRQHGSAAEAVAVVEAANGARAALMAEQARADEQIAGLRAELARLAGVRSLAEVKAALDGVVGSGGGKVPVAVWRRTNGCAADQITRPDSAAACEPVSALRIENGRALERESLRRRLDAAEAARAALVARLAAAPAEKPAPVQARGFAEAAGLVGLDPRRVEHVMSRLDKVLLALFLELGAVLGIEYGLAGLLRAPVRTTAAGPSGAAAPARARTVPAGPSPVPDRPKVSSARAGQSGSAAGGRSDGPVSREQAAADLVTLLALGQSVPSQRALSVRWRRPKQTVSDWLAAWEAAGTIPPRRQVGREKMVTR